MSEVLVEVIRGEMVESVHRGDLVAVDTTGEVIYSLGDTHKKTFWRSAAKPFLAIPLVEGGGIIHFGFTGEELALMLSSHNGELCHVAVAKKVLGKLGLASEALQCGKAAPLSQQTAKKMLGKGEPFNCLTNPCSGKHLGMIALALLKKYPVEGYSRKEHPVQQEMLKTVAQVTGLPADRIVLGTDGCGVPVYGLPLYNMAKAYAALAKPTGFSENRCATLQIIARAMTGNPYIIAGNKRLDTVLMEVTKGRILGKEGAEGVYCLSVMDRGIGLALKIEDGNRRAIDPLIVTVLHRLGFLRPEEREQLEEKECPKVLNHKKEVIGAIKSVI